MSKDNYDFENVFENYESGDDNEDENPEIKIKNKTNTPVKDKKTSKSDNKKLLAMFPGKPKRSLSSYLLFYQAVYEEYREKHKIPLNEVAQHIGIIWNELSEDKKKPFIDNAEKLKENYFHLMRQWVDRYKNDPSFPLHQYSKFCDINPKTTSPSKLIYGQTNNNNNDSMETSTSNYETTTSVKNLLGDNFEIEKKIFESNSNQMKIEKRKNNIFIQEWSSRSCSHEKNELCLYCKSSSL